MILLTSTTDQLQVVTSTGAAVDAHASWVDTQGTAPSVTITPGRKNTNITTATTTAAVPPPAAGVQRNLKTLHIRNKDAGLSCDVTVQHTDGTTVSQLYVASLAPGDMLMYTDQLGFGGGRISPVSGSGLLPIVRVITISGTYTPTPGMVYAIVECVGGGGGSSPGGDDGTLQWGGAGGAGGGYSRKLLTAAAIGPSQTVSVGQGGAAGVAGTDTTFGTLVVAKGGGASTNFAAGGVCPSTGGVGDVTARGGPGQQGSRDSYTLEGSVAHAGCGGDSVYGGGGVGGGAGGNYGGGGGGGPWRVGSATAGGNGVIIITEHFNL